MSKTTVNNKATTVNKATTGKKVNGYKVTNPLYSKARLDAICKVDTTFNIQVLDTMLSNCDKKAQLTTMDKNNKVLLGSYYLLFVYKERVKVYHNEMIHRFKFDNSVYYDDELKCFRNELLQDDYIKMCNVRDELLKGIDQQIQLLPIRLHIDNLYQSYCKYQLAKSNNLTDALEQDVYKMRLAQWLTKNNIQVSEDLLVYLSSEITMKSKKGISLDTTKDSSNLRVLFTKEEFMQEFTKVLTQLLINKGVINKASYLTNKHFLNSLDGLPCKDCLEFLQDVIATTDIKE